MGVADTAFQRGDEVVLRGQPSRRGIVVGGPRQGQDGPSYEVFMGDRRVWVSASQLDRAGAASVRWVTARRFLRDLAVSKLSHPFADILYSVGASRTRFLVYQFQPVLKFVQAMPHGMLIADEVGLGKTVEAGLILKELLARGSLQRVLVVCPANLREKWRSEMRNRFGLEFRILNAKDLREMRSDVEQGGWPSFLGIASLESLRRDEVREILEETRLHFDLVIVDEAHHLRNPLTLSYDLGETLSDQADHILLLSATPVQTSEVDLLSLLRLVEPAEFELVSPEAFDDLLVPNRFINAALAELSKPDPDLLAAASHLRGVLTTELVDRYRDNPRFRECLARLAQPGRPSPEVLVDLRRGLQELHTLARYYTRTRKREVEGVATRRSHVIAVTLTKEEATFYQALVDCLRAVIRERAPWIPAAWALSMRERQAASCLHAMGDVVAELLTGALLPTGVESTDPDLSQEGGAGLASNALPDILQVRVAQLRHAAAALAASGIDSKGQELVHQIRMLLEDDPKRKILLFTFFKGTLRHLSRLLQDAGIGYVAVSGDDPPDVRAGRVEKFQQDPQASVLLSTEVGAEGLDFQFCDTVMNYDLPWNPMRVEQRIGRIDRFGQPKPVIHVVSFFVDGTIDTRILQRLYERVRVFEESIGELEPILGPVVRKLERQVFSPELTEEEVRRETEEALRRVETLRRQYEELEQHRAELLGQGDLLRQAVDSTVTSGRYVSPAELHALIAEWTEGLPHGLNAVKPTRQQSVWDLHLSAEAIGRLYQLLQRQHRTEPAAAQLLRRIQQDGHAWCTFDGEVAQQRPGLPFIDVAHPIAQVALADAQREPPGAPFGRIGALRLSGQPGWPPVLALFLYRLEMSGLEPQVTLLPVPVDARTRTVRDDLGDALLGSLAGAQDAEPPDELDADAIALLEDAAHRYADTRRVTAEAWASRSQQARVEARRDTLTRSYQARIRRREMLLSYVINPQIRRIHEGHIRNLQAELEAKLADLDRVPQPTATLELMAVAVVMCGAEVGLPLATG